MTTGSTGHHLARKELLRSRTTPVPAGINVLYYLYGLERVGRLTARRFIPLFPTKPGQPDRADWYREGAEHLVRSQDPLSGFWTPASAMARPIR